MSNQLNRRKWQRSKREGREVLLRNELGEQTVAVIDVSIAGIAVVAASNEGLAVDDLVQLHWNGDWIQAVIRNINPANGNFRVGIDFAA